MRNPPNTIATDTLVEAIARAVAERLEAFDVNGIPQAALTAITDAGFVVCPREPTPEMVASAWDVIATAKRVAGIAKLGPGPGASDVYRAMINTGRETR